MTTERSASGRGRRLLRLAVIVTVAIALGLGAQRVVRSVFLSPGEPDNLALGSTAADLPESSRPTVVATGLDTPWEIRFLPGGNLLVTERGGRLVHLAPDGTEVEAHRVPGVVERGESGLMGMALHPDFESNRRLYLCFTTDGSSGLENRVERWRYDGGLHDRTAVLTGMPAASNHDGCRLEFGPDGYLYVTLGDAGRADRAQDRSSLSGKILRVTDQGRPVPGNPFGSEVFSYGHRNPQGLAFDDQGRLWSTEHGPSGGRSGHDEVNRVERGRNYGWPDVVGDESEAGMTDPVVHSGPDVTWAPAGAAWVPAGAAWAPAGAASAPARAGGRLFFVGLRGQALYELRPDGQVVPHLFREFGRLRALRTGPDGHLWFGTSNRDGRGSPHGDDDRILRVDPRALIAEG